MRIICCIYMAFSLWLIKIFQIYIFIIAVTLKIPFYLKPNEGPIKKFQKHISYSNQKRMAYVSRTNILMTKNPSQLKKTCFSNISINKNKQTFKLAKITVSEIFLLEKLLMHNSRWQHCTCCVPKKNYYSQPSHILFMNILCATDL